MVTRGETTAHAKVKGECVRKQVTPREMMREEVADKVKDNVRKNNRVIVVVVVVIVQRTEKTSQQSGEVGVQRRLILLVLFSVDVFSTPV